MKSLKSWTNQSDTSTLWSRRKEADLDFLFAQFVCKFVHSVPCTPSNSLFEFFQVVYEMDLAASINLYSVTTLLNPKNFR